MVLNEAAGDVTSVDLVGATIDQLSHALATKAITSVELVTLYLRRIAYFDRRGPCLKSTPVLNPDALADAAEADRQRALGATCGPLHGIPFTVKDSYKAKGLTVAAGSPAFADLIAQDDSFVVAALRKAGAILLGKTNMPPMAIGGVQRGLYGRAESPYNPDYLPAAWHSGSSSGSGVAVASNLCAFGLGEETVSSGRSPASNNGLVAYTPSRGIISIRGNWPLFPLRDTVVPHTRTVRDMLHVLDAIAIKDSDTRGDLWRTQKTVNLASIDGVHHGAFLDLAKTGSLAGRRLGVPKMYIDKDNDSYEKISVRPSILTLWQEAAATLAKLGAVCVEVDFPVVSAYEKGHPGAQDLYDRKMLPEGWNNLEINDMVSAAWEEFLQLNGDPQLSTLGDVDPWTIHADPPDAVDTRRKTKAHPGRDSINYQRIVDRAIQGGGSPQTFPQLPEVMEGLERARVELFENWLRKEGLDGVVFPANADIAASDSDVDPISSAHAWLNGTVFSNMNHVMRHLGIPSTTVTMGVMEDTGMPVGLTFAGAAYTDRTLLSYAYDYEMVSQKRVEPEFAPPLSHESITISKMTSDLEHKSQSGDISVLPEIRVSAEGILKRSGDAQVQVDVSLGQCQFPLSDLVLRIYIDGVEVEHVDGKGETEISAQVRRAARLASSLVIATVQNVVTGLMAGKTLEVRYKK
ncbi:hypothetical protein BP5796_07645 [Coleophoma crateriformis]|uniref:Amidase domain-containing protein n=1 Tax=Coleophoma crateriformis TaxID=565419 RepID=A0A3D8RJH5_9HELO|nr:hypothetical protein BP5796_07645 [Coleophoma crateriformis]